MKRFLRKNSFMVLLALLNGALAAYATPVSDWGDPTEYILLSQSFLGQETGVSLAHRSPLFSIILAGFMLFLKPPLVYKVVVIFQYFLLALITWMLFRVFQRVFSGRKPAMLAALLFNLSFATIFFANMIQSEILTVFLTVLSVMTFMRVHDEAKPLHFVALGALAGLLSLARFSAVPMILTYVVLLFIVLAKQKAPVRKWGLSIGLFFIPYLLLFNAWCLYNHYEHGFYGLFPHNGQGISKNIIVSSIRPEYKVSEANQPVMAIFLKAREAYLAKSPIEFKGSLVKYDKLGILNSLYGGYTIYLEATPELRRHFGLPPSSGEYELSRKLADFYAEISSQNQAFILQFRFISFLNGLRASDSSTLPPELGEINLDVLPGFIFKIYRLAFAGISLFVLIAFFFFAAKGIKNRWNFDFTLLTMFLIVFSFWGINFAFVTASDASRFKFPADPFILGLFVYYAALIGEGLAARFRAWSQQRQMEVN